MAKLRQILNDQRSDAVELEWKSGQLPLFMCSMAHTFSYYFVKWGNTLYTELVGGLYRQETK